MDLSDVSHDASGTRAALELRVISGLQAGARALLPSDGSWTTLGRDEDNDLVLREAPFETAEIGLLEEGWAWRQNGQDPLPLRAGQGIRLEGFVLLLSSPTAPWAQGDPSDWAIDSTAGVGLEKAAPEPLEANARSDAAVQGTEQDVQADQLVAAQARDTQAPAPDEGQGPAVAEGLAPSAPEEATASAPAAAMPTLPWAQRVRARLKTPLARRSMVAGGVGALALAAWSLYPAAGLQSQRSVPEPALATGATGAVLAPVSAAAPSPDATGSPQLEAAQAVLAREPLLAGGLGAFLGGDGQVVIRGVVNDDESLETVLRPAVREGLRLSLQVLTTRELALRIQGLKALMPAGVSAQASPDGRVRLEGVVASSTSAEALRAAVAQEIPELLGVDSALLTTAAQQQAQMTTPTAASGQQAALPPMKPLPEVVSLIGGSEAYIVLADGLRVATGGQVGTWRVQGISADRVTFVDAHGRSRVLAP